jgi:acetyl esterase/lipase
MTDTAKTAPLDGIDPTLRPALLAPYRTAPAPGETAIETERRRRREINASRRRGEVGVQIEEMDLAGVPVRRYQSVSEPDRWMVWVHGGGWIYGEAADDESMLAEFSRAGLGVVAVGYRLAPENPFPAAVHDVLSVVASIPGEVILGGASAGAAIAGGAALRLKERGDTVAGLFLICPALDDRARADSDAWLTRAQMDLFWRDYLGTTEADAYAAPARAESLAGLPKTFITTTTADPLREEAWEFGRRLAAEAVPVTIEHRPGGYHGFEYEAPDAAFTRRTVAHWAGVLARWAD